MPKPAESTNTPFIAIQVGAVSFVDEGVAPLLDLLQEKGRINALFLATHSFDPGTASRQIKGHALPDHGVQEYDDLIGGNFATPHRQYYGQTAFKEFKSSDYGEDFDILEMVLPEAKKRAIKVYCWITESPNYNLPSILPGFGAAMEVDVNGKKGTQPCLNNPDYRNMYIALYEDYVKSYEIDGMALCSERQGALGNLLSGGWGGRDIACFCPHCRDVAQGRGIAVHRAIEGYRKLSELFETLERDLVVQDGAFVSFWRLLLRYPEILAWEQLFADSQFQLYRDLFSTVKAINPGMPVGWHIMHLNSYNPFYRAEQDFETLKGFSDFMKLALYQHCAGPRFARWIDGVHRRVFREAEKETLVSMMYDLLGIFEASYDKLRTSAFSGDYVKRETERAIRGTGGGVEIYPGIGIDVPTGPQERKTTPADVDAGIKGAFEGGAAGVILSRKYSEMKLANLEAAGKALKELGF